MEIVFLGTSSMVPTKDRNPSSVFISTEKAGILVDCGEGTQRQMKIAGIKLTKISIILLTHWHGDHVLGLPGLLQSLGASDYNQKLKIIGPTGTKNYFKHLEKSFIYDRPVDMEIKEFSKGKAHENEDIKIECFPLEHGVKTLGFNIIKKDKRKINLKKAKKLGIPEGPLLGKLQKGKSISLKAKKIRPEDVTTLVKGKKVTIISDTSLCNSCINAAKDAELLISEATYASELKDKAQQYKHLTSEQAAEIANKAGAKRLILTHFSGRYKDVKQLEEDAKTLFSNTVCAYDFMKIKV